jgi:hypothetical protein
MPTYGKETEGRRERRRRGRKRRRGRGKGKGERGSGRGRGKRGRKGGVRGREEKERVRRRGSSCGLHFFKGTVVQDFWSELFASNSSFGSHWAQRKLRIQKIQHVGSINKPQRYITQKIGENVIFSFLTVAGSVKLTLNTKCTFLSRNFFNCLFCSYRLHLLII